LKLHVIGCKLSNKLVSCSNMGTRKVELGATGHAVAANSRRIRELRGMTLQDVSDRLTRYGRPIARSGLSKIEAAARRVDVDDLVALAEVLGAAPDDLLAAPDAAPKDLDPAEVMLRVAAELTAAGRVLSTVTDSAGLTDAADLSKGTDGER
jgi:transcriptional regulator with XRE-family HTH domain